MNSGDITTLRVGDAATGSACAWAAGMEITIPRSIFEINGLTRCVTAGNLLDVEKWTRDVNKSIARDVLLEAAFTDKKPASSRLMFSYQRIPPRLRALVGSVIGRLKARNRNSWAAFPRWPMDLTTDILADLTSGRPSPFVGSPTPVILSHDLDSPEGLRSFIDSFAGIEESMGARSVNFVVPCGWKIDDGLVNEIGTRGHEIGVHGYDHSNRTPFAAPEEMRQRVESAKPFIARFGAQGYRAPSLLRTRKLLRNLAKIYSYDSSIPTSGGLFPIPNNGCASARPFHVEGINEIPLSMPRDGSLLFLHHKPEEILSIWIDAANLISRSGGVVMLLTHCEQRFSGNPEMLEVYQKFLEFVSSDDRFTWSSPQKVLGVAFAEEASTG